MNEAIGAATADKVPDTNIGRIWFLWDLQVKKRTDERTRTADLVSLRVRSHSFRVVSRYSKNRLPKSSRPIWRFPVFQNVRLGYCQSAKLAGLLSNNRGFI